jgi:hypothetical protein
VTLDMCPRAQVIGKDDAWAKEYVIRHVYTLKDHHLVLDGDAVADSRTALNEGTVTDIAVTSNARAREDVGECPDSSPLPDVIALAQSLWMYEDTIQ